MYTQNRNNIERHVKTHSQRSDEDRSAVTILETFLRANGKISTNFSKEDKWPNIDGTLEFVENPLITRRPKQNFFVQIKGTHLYTETDNGIKYSLKSLAFPALQNLQRRIDNPGPSSDFISIDSFTKRVNLPDYDIIFVDECSTIDNRTMSIFLEKMNSGTFLVLAGDIYQIESIDFGNWFFYAKDIIKSYGANIELHNTWRTQNQTLINLWNAVRNKEDLITEILAIDGPFSEDIGPKLLEREDDDEVILCLNYDGKFGLNNMNNYFQNANKKGEAISWREWTYKVGDPILFNETKRFPLLYNNLKGRIVGIVKDAESVTFTIDIEVILTEMDCQGQDFELVDVFDNSSRISLTVYAYDDNTSDLEDSSRMNSIVPFQLAYAVSIHKAQGLEYDSVKVIIPQSNSEKITHGIFYTAITRAKKKLKIYWSAETMKEIVSGFATNESNGKSLEIVKAKLAVTQ